MPERVTKEEKIVELAILKAKEVLAEFKNGTTVANKENVMGEEVKLKSPPKNPKEEKIKNPTGDEGYGYVGKSVMKEGNPFLDDERDRETQSKIRVLESKLDDVKAKLEELEITGSDKNSMGFDATQGRRQKKLLQDEERITQQIGRLHETLGKAIMLKRLLTIAKGLDLVKNLEMDSITKGAIEDLEAQYKEAFQRFITSPMKESDAARYQKEFSELRALAKKLGLDSTTFMDAEHGAAAQDKRRYKFKL